VKATPAVPDRFKVAREQAEDEDLEGLYDALDAGADDAVTDEDLEGLYEALGG
jgi:hypothetical protein